MSAMWLLPKIVAEKGVKNLQVFGDSKLMVYWENNKCGLDNIVPEPLRNQVLGLKEIFEYNSISYIFIKSLINDS
jgi:hypothetical protein